MRLSITNTQLNGDKLTDLGELFGRLLCADGSSEYGQHCMHHQPIRHGSERIFVALV